jgi:predicted transcriptional regulator
MKTHTLLPADFHARSLVDRKRYLDSAADKVIHNETDRKPLSDEQIETLRFDLEKLSIKLADLNEQYDDVKKQWRDDIKEAKENVEEVLTQLRAGMETVRGTVYEIRDYETNRVFRFFEDGSELGDRPMLPEERQQTIQSDMRRVENN